jgi:putative ribosome biogenesis GTPase RsgA
MARRPHRLQHPAGIGFQLEDDQAALIDRTVNVVNLKDPKFVHNLIQRYLVQYDLQSSAMGPGCVKTPWMI